MKHELAEEYEEPSCTTNVKTSKSSDKNESILVFGGL